MPYHHFTPKEQYVIAHMTIAGFSQREIGRRLGRHHASIGREIRRNRPTYADDAVYWYDAAEYYANERRRRPRHRRKAARKIGLVRHDGAKCRALQKNPPETAPYPDRRQRERVLSIQGDRSEDRPCRLLCRSLCCLAAGNQR